MIDVETFVRKMPKVELHVHLEGSVRPETFLKLAKHHHVALPADSIEGLRDEFSTCCGQFTWDRPLIVRLVFNALEVSLLAEPEKHSMRENVLAGFSKLGSVWTETSDPGL